MITIEHLKKAILCGAIKLSRDPADMVFTKAAIGELDHFFFSQTDFSEPIQNPQLDIVVAELFDDVDLCQCIDEFIETYDYIYSFLRKRGIISASVSKADRKVLSLPAMDGSDIQLVTFRELKSGDVVFERDGMPRICASGPTQTSDVLDDWTVQTADGRILSPLRLLNSMRSQSIEYAHEFTYEWLKTMGTRARECSVHAAMVSV